MVIEVSGSAGPVVGIAVKTTVSPSAEVCGSLTETIRVDGGDLLGQAREVGGVDAGGVEVDHHQQRDR